MLVLLSPCREQTGPPHVPCTFSHDEAPGSRRAARLVTGRREPRRASLQLARGRLGGQPRGARPVSGAARPGGCVAPCLARGDGAARAEQLTRACRDGLPERGLVGPCSRVVAAPSRVSLLVRSTGRPPASRRAAPRGPPANARRRHRDRYGSPKTPKYQVPADGTRARTSEAAERDRGRRARASRHGRQARADCAAAQGAAAAGHGAVAARSRCARGAGRSRQPGRGLRASLERLDE
jgi:hypothetical protein